MLTKIHLSAPYSHTQTEVPFGKQGQAQRWLLHSGGYSQCSSNSRKRSFNTKYPQM